MAGKTNTSATFFAQKKLLGKAHTSNLKIDGEETIGSNIQVASSLIFGETIPENPSRTLNTVQGTVEYIEFILEALTGTTYDANDDGGGSGVDSGEELQTSGPHAYKFKFPSNYESITDNSSAGSGGFSNDALVHESLGKVQIIPPFFSQNAPNPYIVKIYQDDGSGNAGTEIPLLDNIDWNIDYYNGILFLQDYSSSKIPAFARGFAYIGKMLNTVVSEASGGGGGGGDGDSQAEYIVLTATGSLPNAKVIEAGSNITITESSGKITISSQGTSGGAINGREKYSYFITSSHPAGSGLSVGDTDFSSVNYDVNKIDIFYNGVLIHSGSSTEVSQNLKDYYISSSGSISFGFDLFSDDIVDTVLSVVGNAESGADSGAEYIVLTATGSLPNAKVLTAGENIEIQESGNEVIISSTGISLVNGRNKSSYFITSSHASGNPLITQNSNFNSVTFDNSKIDVIYNGSLIHSGTQQDVSDGTRDYALASSGSIIFGFDLFQDDIIDVIINIVGGIPDQEKPDNYASYLVLNATSSLANERVINIGTGLKFNDAGAGGNYTIEIEKEMVFNDVLSGDADGTNTHFILSNTPFSTSKISVFLNGMLQVPPDLLEYQDYSVTGSSVYFTTASTPPAGSWIMANYYIGV